MNTASWASSKAKILAQLNTQIKKLEGNMSSALSKIQSSAYTGMTAGDAEAEKLYIMASNQLNTAKAQYEEIQTEFSTYNAGFSSYTPSFGSGSFDSGSTGSSSGGSDSSSTETEVEDMDVESLVDRYVDLNNAVTKVENSLNLLEIAQENASDEEKLKLIQQEIDLYNQKRVALENLRKEQQSELGELKSSLNSSGFNFSSDGSISNINSQLETLTQNANKLSGEAKENAIENVKSISETVEAYNDLLLETIPETESSIKEISNTIIDAQKDIVDILEQQKDEYIDNLEKETDALKSALEERKALLEKEWDEEDYTDELSEKQEQLNDLEDSLALALRTGDEELIKSIRLQITESQKEIDTFIRDNERDSISERFDEEVDSIETDLDDQIDMINEKLSDEELLKLVQSGVTDLNGVLTDITNSTSNIKSTFSSVGDIISNNWMEGLNSFITKLTSLDTLMPNLNYSLNGGSGAVNNITINSDLIIQGNVDEGIMPDLKKALSSIKDEIITEIANKMTR